VFQHTECTCIKCSPHCHTMTFLLLVGHVTTKPIPSNYVSNIRLQPSSGSWGNHQGNFLF
jgi:hypothetical protein